MGWRCRTVAENESLLAEAQRDGLPALAAAINRRDASRSTASLEYLLVDDIGKRLAWAMEAEVPSREGFEEFLRYRHSDGQAEGLAQALTTRVPGGRLVVAADRADLDEIDRTLAVLFTSAVAAMLVLGLAAAGGVGWLTRRRLNRIDATAQAIIEGDLGRRIPRDGSDSEFDRLSATLNRMLDRIESLVDSVRQVSSDVAHDLRTPLTRLCGRLDLAMEAQGDEARSQLLLKAREQASELLEIFAALLRIAEIEGLSDNLPRRKIDLSALLNQMVETYRPDFEDSERGLEPTIASGLTADGDRRLLSQAVANLLDNGLRHTPPGAVVAIKANRCGGELVLRVSDDGPGVADQDRERLFRRFARAEQSRTSDGHGLGLSMVEAIVHAHGGSARILGGEGFTIELRIPASPV